MYRRALLLAVAGFAGCTGLVSSGGDSANGPTGAGSDASEPERGGTVENDESPTPATPEDATSADETPSTAELQAMTVEELLALAREQTDRAVDAYAGEGRPLSAVTATTDSFDPAPVIEQLYRARAAYEAADRQGIAAEQGETIRRLRWVEGFLRLAIDSQVLLIEAHADLEELADAIGYVDAETVSSVRDRIANRHQQASDIVSELSQTRYAQSVDVVDRLSRADYDAKRLQLETETEVLKDLLDSTAEVLDGVRLLSRARGKRQNGSPYAAATLGKDAEVSFGRGVTELEGVTRSLPRQGQGFSDVAASLLTTTRERRLEARTLYEDVD